MTALAAPGGLTFDPTSPDLTRSDWLKIYLGFAGMALGQFMAMLDMQIVASSLSQIQAGVGANADEIAWVQTIYILAEVLIIPLTAYLSKLWGTRPFFLAACAFFMIASMLTGLSATIEMMIFTRALQGLAAGAMMPMVFATSMSVFPPEKRVAAMVYTSLIITLAPTIGPTLGGHLTEALSWRWLFFINVPAGAVCLFLVGRYGGFDRGDPALAKGIDWWGAGLMSVCLLSIQYVVEEGNKKGWFADDVILWLTVAGVITGVAFIWRQLTYRQPIVSLKPFGDLNFVVGMVMGVISGMSLFGAVFILPLYLGQVLRYSAAETGTTMLVGGLTMMLAAPLAARLARYIEPRVAMVSGFTISAWALALGVRITDRWGFWEFAFMQVVRSLGTMIAMTGTQQISIATLPVSMMKDASSLITLVRNIGGAFGLAILSSIITHQTAAHYNDLAARMGASNPVSVDFMEGMAAMMAQSESFDPGGAGRKAFSFMLHREALVLAFADAFAFLAVGCLFAAAVVFFARPAKTPPPAQLSGGH